MLPAGQHSNDSPFCVQPATAAVAAGHGAQQRLQHASNGEGSMVLLCQDCALAVIHALQMLHAEASSTDVPHDSMQLKEAAVYQPRGRAVCNLYIVFVHLAHHMQQHRGWQGNAL